MKINDMVKHFFLLNSIKNMHFKNKLLLCFVILSIIPTLIIGSYAYIKSTKMSEEKTISSFYNTLEQADINISKITSQVQQVSNIITTNGDIINILDSGGSKVLSDQIQDYNTLLKFITSLEKGFNLYKIRIFLNNNAVYKNNGANFFDISDLNASKIDVFNQTTTSKLQWIPTYSHKYLINNEQQIFSAYTVLRRYKPASNIMCVIFIDILENNLASVLKGMNPQDQDEKTYNNYILDSTGNVISSSDKAVTGKKLKLPYMDRIIQEKDGDFKYDNNIIIFKKINNIDWFLISVIDTKTITYISKPIKNITTLVILGSCLFAIFTGVLLSRSLTKKIKHLFDAMKQSQYTDYNFKPQLADTSNSEENGDEIDSLIICYNKQVSKIKELVDEIYKVKVNEMDAKLKALYSNINPHFLYNTLDSVKSCLDRNMIEEATQMICYLGSFFRIALSRGKDKITIKEELDMISNYLIIQTMNYGNKLNWKIEVNNDIYPFLISRFTLQPIVENALCHGIFNKKGKGEIVIYGDFDEDNIKLQVEDNGVGIEKSKLEKLQEDIRNGVYDSKKGYGLSNVNARLKLHSGENYGLNIKSEENKGTIVEIIIPQEV